MRIVLLTTATTHHLYFAWKVSRLFPFQAIVLETKSLSPSFPTAHAFESARDDYERKVLSDLRVSCDFDKICDTHSFESINSEDCVEFLRELSPEVFLVFGTGKILPPVIRIPTRACLNLHGGNPEQYRGLDSHLWTIYHNDFQNLITTLHVVDEQLDAGDIVLQKPLPLAKEMALHQLRLANTEICIEMTLEAFRHLRESGRLPGRKQEGRGRYYSFMPTALKEECVRKFDKYINQI